MDNDAPSYTNGNTSEVQILPPHDLAAERAAPLPDDFSGIVPVLPVRDIVAFPGVIISLPIARPFSLRAVEAALGAANLLFITAQKHVETEMPGPDDLHAIGVVGRILRVFELPGGGSKVLFQGVERARVESIAHIAAGYLEAHLKLLKHTAQTKPTVECEETIARVRKSIKTMVEYERVSEEMLLLVEDTGNAGALADLVLAHYRLDAAFAQSALEELDPLKRLKIAEQLLADDINQFFVMEKVREKARDELTRGQEEYYLREQLRLIQKELGEEDSASEDLAEIQKQLCKAKLPKEAEAEAFKQLKRLERMQVDSSEYALLRTYLEWIVDLPWSKRTRDRVDLRRAENILNEDHYGLDKPKERILEYLSVRKLKKDSRGPLLCFVGPPGVGKTSLGQSIARALNRKFNRMSLGGVRDEAEIRGHRRTYVGALPGRVLQGMKQAGSKNPVFLLDELDKIGADFRGDPASALLEVLDPQQNKAFRDHYLNIDFDLSEVLFIGTANTTDTIPQALLDRLEVIHISGYTTDEKLNIARKFLIPRQIEANGLSELNITFQERALLFLIERYTREAGVRNLEREIGSLCRKIARRYADHDTCAKKVTPQLVQKMLGPTQFDPETREDKDVSGLVQGLAWTAHGGEVMPVEASVAPGNGKLSLTGQLGTVMQESAQAALFYARANARALDLPEDFHDKLDVHVHVPGGAIPKDGPSAGITICTALLSALSEQEVAHDVAMTGEITLRGNVLAVGGIKEKVLAAIRYGIKRVILPRDNIKDLEELTPEQRRKVDFVPVSHIREVVPAAFKALPRSLKPTATVRSIKRRARAGEKPLSL
jgi:ATP-dependent Lon protease